MLQDKARKLYSILPFEHLEPLLAGLFLRGMIAMFRGITKGRLCSLWLLELPFKCEFCFQTYWTVIKFLALFEQVAGK